MAEERYNSRHTGQEIDDAVDAVGSKADVINIGGAKKLLLQQSPLVSLLSIEQVDDADAPNNKMWWSSDNGHLKYKQNDVVYDLGSPAYTLYYCDDKIYKWGGSGNGFIEMAGGESGKIINTNVNDPNHNTPYSVWIGTQAELEALNGDYDENTIYLVGTIPQAVTRYSVNTNGLTHCTVPDGTPTKVTENGSFTVVVSPESGYTIDSCQATMGSSTINGVPLTGANAGKYQITINAVTANIVIKASASVHLKSITVTQGTRAGNAIQMNAALNPANAENVTLQWSVSGSQYVNIDPSTGLLTILEGASNESVTVTCTDTNSASGTASGTLQLTGLSYNDVITSLSSVGATRTGTNTLRLNADGRTSGVNFSLQGTVPTVKEVHRTTTTEEVEGETVETTTHELVDVPAVTLNGNMLTYKGDCTVRIKATAATDSSITCTNDIVITHDNADQIWFEDVETLKAVNDKSIGAATGSVLTRTDDPTYAGCVTYAQAADVHVLNMDNNTTIVSFNEFEHFTGIKAAGISGASDDTMCRFSGCTSLEYIKFPSSLTTLRTQSAAESGNYIFKGCKFKELHLPSTIKTIGNDALRGLAYVEKISTYATSIGSYAFSALKKVEKLELFAETQTTLGTYAFSSMVSDPTTALTVDLGPGISSIPAYAFRYSKNLNTVILRSNAIVSSVGNAFNGGNPVASLHLEVPFGLVQSYKDSEDAPWVNFSDDNISAIKDNTVNPGEGGQS